MGAFGFGVLVQAVIRLVAGATPAASTMGVIGSMALAANIACLLLLYGHRSDDLNLRSTWLCSRNDIIANVAVLAAAGMVALVESGWPDVLVGGLIALLFLRSAVGVVGDATRELRATPAR
jgi:Co/Zn/Cd efflux system component